MLGNFKLLLPSTEFLLRLFFSKVYLSGVQIECQTVWIQIMPDILALSGFRPLTKFSRQIFDEVGSKYGVFLHSRKIQQHST